MPVRSPYELYAVGPTARANLDLNPLYFSHQFYRHLVQRDPAFEDVFGSSVVFSSGVHLSAEGAVARVRAELMSGNYFRVLGVSARLGRTIVEADDRSVGANVVVLSGPAWRQWFGSRPDVVGQTIPPGYPYTVIGVAVRR